MKKLKKILLFGMILVFALPFFLFNIKPKDKASAADPVIHNIFATISVSGQTLQASSLNTVDGVTYITTTVQQQLPLTI